MKTGQKIREKRREKRMTQSQLASRLSVSGQSIANWENGTVQPTRRTITALAAALECEEAELIGEDGTRADKAQDENEKIQMLNETIVLKNNRIKELEAEVDSLLEVDNRKEVEALRSENRKLRAILSNMMIEKALKEVKE